MSNKFASTEWLAYWHHRSLNEIPLRCVVNLADVDDCSKAPVVDAEGLTTVFRQLPDSDIAHRVQIPSCYAIPLALTLGFIHHWLAVRNSAELSAHRQAALTVRALVHDFLDHATGACAKGTMHSEWRHGDFNIYITFMWYGLAPVDGADCVLEARWRKKSKACLWDKTRVLGKDSGKGFSFTC